MTQRLEKCICVKCCSSVKPQSDRLVEDKQAHTSHKMKNSVKSFCASFLLTFNLKSWLYLWYYPEAACNEWRRPSPQLSFELRRNVASHWRWREQHCIRFDRLDIEPQISDFESNIVTATPISRLPIHHVDVRVLANSRGSVSNFTFCILCRKILVFAYIPSIVSCKTNLDLLLMCYWYALMAETALPVHCNKKIEQH